MNQKILTHSNGFLVEEERVPYSWTYADAAARTAATGFTSSDVGKFARQLDNESFWKLKGYSPIVWEELGAGASGGSYFIAGSFIGTPPAGNDIFMFVVNSDASSISLPANLAGSEFAVKTNPTLEATFTIKKNWALIGATSTIVVSTAGVFTVTTDATTIAPGDVISIEATTPGGIVTPGWTIKGTV